MATEMTPTLTLPKAPERQAPLTVTIREACRLTGLSRRTIYRQEKLGGLTFVKVGHRTLVTYKSLSSLLRPL